MLDVSGVTTGEVPSWVGRGEGCSYTLRGAQDSPPHGGPGSPPACHPSPGTLSTRLRKQVPPWGFLLTLFLDFSCLSCFPPETCWLHVHAGKRRHVQPKTTHRPSAHPPDPHRLEGAGRTPRCSQPATRTDPGRAVLQDLVWFRNRGCSPKS